MAEKYVRVFFFIFSREENEKKALHFSLLPLFIIRSRNEISQSDVPPYSTSN